MGQETNIANIDVERGLAQFAHGVAQDVHPGPIAPLAQGVVDVVYLVVDRYVRSVGDKLIMLDGQLARLAQVAINMKKRVDRLQVFRLTHLPRVDNPVLLEVESGADASRRTVAFGSIIIVKRLEGAGLHAHHMQQVVVEDLAVDADTTAGAYSAHLCWANISGCAMATANHCLLLAWLSSLPLARCS